MMSVLCIRLVQACKRWLRDLSALRVKYACLWLCGAMQPGKQGGPRSNPQLEEEEEKEEAAAAAETEHS